MSTARSHLDAGAPRHTGAPTYGHNSRHQEGRRSGVQTWASLLGGSTLAAVGLSRRSWPGMAMAAAGGFLIYLGARARQGLHPIHVATSFTINKPVEEVWRFWRNLENLPRFMKHLESVKPTSQRYSYWTARSPLGGKVSWHAEVTDERENEYLVWRSLPGSDLENRGSIEFRRAPGDRGTEILAAIDYTPSAARAGAALAGLLGASAEQQVREDLRRFKQLLEAGEIPTTVGQPHGRRSMLVEAGHRAFHERPATAMPRSA